MSVSDHMNLVLLRHESMSDPLFALHLLNVSCSIAMVIMLLSIALLNVTSNGTLSTSLLDVNIVLNLSGSCRIRWPTCDNDASK